MCEECQNFIKLCILSIGCAIYFYLILYLYFLTIDLAAHCVTVSHASKNIHIYTPIFSTPIFNNNSYVNMNFLLIIVYSICLNLDLIIDRPEFRFRCRNSIFVPVNTFDRNSTGI